jgi:hypothetical protein
MIKLIFLFSTFLFLFSQKSVLVTSTLSGDKYLNFEKEFTKEIIKVYNIKNNLALTIEYTDIITIDKLFHKNDDNIMQFSI